MIAVSPAKRWPVIPDVPTFAEQGIEGVQAEAWMAMVAPAGTPDKLIELPLVDHRASRKHNALQLR